MHAYVITFQVIRADIEVENSRQDDLCIFDVILKPGINILNLFLEVLLILFEKDSL